MSEYSNENAKKFAESIDMTELFDHIKSITGLSDLKFNYKITTNRYDEPYITFESQDLVEKVGFLKLIFSSISISQFNSEIIYSKESDEYYYWGTANFRYDHPSGGSNGCTFLRFRYIHGYWEFDDRG